MTLDAAIRAAIILWAGQLQIPEKLLTAMVLVESGGEECSIRYEPHYRWLYNPHGVKPKYSTIETEQQAQKMSWGPLQIMGATAREIGYRGWLPHLCGPAGVEWGAKYLKRLHDRYGNWNDAIAAYNAGSPRRVDGKYVNQGYVDKINARMV